MPDETAVADAVDTGAGDAGFDESLDSAFEGDAAAAEDAGGFGDPGEPEQEPEPDEQDDAQPEAAEAEEPAEAAAEETAPAEGTPEDVRVTERNGKKEYHLNEGRYGRMTESNQLRGDLEQMFAAELPIDKPATAADVKAAIELRDKAYMGNKEMHLDFLDPQGHDKFLDHWFGQAAAALRDGEIAQDPVTPFAVKFMDRLAEMHPEGYGTVTGHLMRGTIDDIYDLAQQTGNKQLLHAAQHIDNELFFQYQNEDGSIKTRERPASAPKGASRPAPASRSEAQPPGAGVTDQKWRETRAQINQESQGAIDKAVETALAPVKKAYDSAKLTNHYASISAGLNAAVRKVLTDDENFKRAVTLDMRNAAATTSEERRKASTATIVKRHAIRAEQIIKQKLPEILAEAKLVTNGRIETEHQRRAAAQKKQAPGGGGPPQRQSLVAPVSKTRRGQDALSQDLDAIFSSA